MARTRLVRTRQAQRSKGDAPAPLLADEGRQQAHQLAQVDGDAEEGEHERALVRVEVVRQEGVRRGRHRGLTNICDQ